MRVIFIVFVNYKLLIINLLRVILVVSNFHLDIKSLARFPSTIVFPILFPIQMTMMKFLNLRKAAVLSLFVLGAVVPEGYAAKPINANQKTDTGNELKDFLDWIQKQTMPVFSSFSDFYKHFLNMFQVWEATLSSASPTEPNPNPIDNGTSVPIDGGASLLLVAGGAYGLKRLRKAKPKTSEGAQ